MRILAMVLERSFSAYLIENGSRKRLSLGSVCTVWGVRLPFRVAFLLREGFNSHQG